MSTYEMNTIGATDSQKVWELVETVMSDGKERTVQSIKDEVEKITSEKFTDGVFAGVFCRMEKKGVLIRPKRGTYKATAVGEQGTKANIKRIIEKTMVELKREVETVDVIDATDEEMKVIDIVRKTRGMLQNILEELN